MPSDQAFPFDPAYLPLVGNRVPSAVLFAFFEQIFHSYQPTALVLRAPTAFWRLRGLINHQAFWYALDGFGYHYLSRAEFQQARAEQKQYIHPTECRYLLYVMVRDRRNNSAVLIRNAALIDSEITAIHDGPALSEAPPLGDQLDARLWI